MASVVSSKSLEDSAAQFVTKWEQKHYGLGQNIHFSLVDRSCVHVALSSMKFL